MFEPTDNIPISWPRGRKGSRQRFVMSAFERRYLLIQFAKFIVTEYLNGPDDIDKIVDRWLKQDDHEKLGV